MASYTFNSTVEVFSCKLNPNGLFTCDFGGSGTTRDNSFGSLCQFTKGYSGCTFIREEGVISVNDDADYLKSVGVNYCRFKNPNFSTRWIYCFVDMIEYVAPKTSKLHIRTDSFMSYFDLINKNECFVEREHVASDNIFEHTLPEPTPNFQSHKVERLIDYHWTTQTASQIESDFYIGVYASYSNDTASRITPVTDISTCGHVPAIGGRLFLAEVGNAADLFDTLLTQAYEISFACLVPKDAVGIIQTNVNNVWCALDKSENTGWNGDDSQAITIGTTTFDNYTVRNKKLCCYPYHYIEMNDLNEQSVILKPEDMNSNNFFIHPESGANPSFTLYYKDYEGEDNFQNSITVSFPSIPYAIDFYTQYMALNKNSVEFEKVQFGVNLAKSILNTASSAVTGGIAGHAAGLALGARKAAPYVKTLESLKGSYGKTYQQALDRGIEAINVGMAQDYGRLGAATGAVRSGAQASGGIIDTVMGRMQQNAMYSDMKNRPTQTHNPPTGNSKMGMGAVGFHVNRWAPKREYLEILDKFFDMYGYNVSMVKAPQWNSRNHYNYIKTSGANISGQIPQDDKMVINNLLDSGLTVWHNASEYGKYTTNNGV